MLHNALDRAVKERLIVRNPADDCIPPKILKHEMKILPPEQIKSYLTAAEQRGVLPMFYLELISGLRKGELAALQWIAYKRCVSRLFAFCLRIVNFEKHGSK